MSYYGYLVGGLVATALLTSIWIRFSAGFGLKQQVRDDGPKAHLGKAGTPTMGGSVFWLVAAVGCAIQYSRESAFFIVVLVLFGLTGLIDDLVKIRKGNARGIRARSKLVMQFIAAVLALWFHLGGMPSEVILGLGTLDWVSVPLFVYLPVAAVLIVGTVNAVNFADGADGLLSSMAVPTAGFIVIASMTANAQLLAAMTGGILLGFLVYNRYPAKVMMGDTGSMAIGGAIVALFLLSRMELLLPLVCLPYYLEILSVAAQVIYFRKTGGRRLFKMSPLHHHFELSGYSERTVVAGFTIASFLCAAAGAAIVSILL